MESRKKYLIIAAAGKSTRMGNDIPKQYSIINGKEVLYYTIKAFLPYVETENIIVAISSAHTELWEKLVTNHTEFEKIKMIIGGPERFHTVKAALKYIPKDSLLAIHDAARPLIDKNTINLCFETALHKGSAIPVISVSESMRISDGNDNKVVDRTKIKIVQTPQTFKSELIKEAYNVNYQEAFTDDASVFESASNKVFLCNGISENFKITNKYDLELASLILQDRDLSS